MFNGEHIQEHKIEMDYDSIVSPDLELHFIRFVCVCYFRNEIPLPDVDPWALFWFVVFGIQLSVPLPSQPYLW